MNLGSWTLLEWFETFYLLFWAGMSVGILISVQITLYARSTGNVPSFVQSLVLYGKFQSMVDLHENHQSSSSSSSLSISFIWARVNQLVRKLEIPKSSFRHFYIFSLLINFVVVGLVCWNGGEPKRLSWSSVLLIACQVVQSVRRLYETFFVSIYSDNKINVLHYLVALAFYLSTGYATIRAITDYTPKTYCLGHFISNLSLFLLFSTIQYLSHLTLARLRHEDGESKSNVYKVPRGGLFEYIACPHYLSEIVIYSVLIVFAQRHPTWLALGGFVLVNQTMSALLAHQWYRLRFGESYPKRIKAIIPFVL